MKAPRYEKDSVPAGRGGTGRKAERDILAKLVTPATAGDHRRSEELVMPTEEHLNRKGDGQDALDCPAKLHEENDSLHQ
jgi:hypothetical protein